ncbi:NERD domain-containing protein [Viridibacillus sp. YIM B01967]|uniref:NERD domain-containing protein n=1 Tax=Viridibacillus soli TaxID=2798301 RepID=A0ABS1H709_9BACL|nr:nuclease-related domain-containing protein [Viridibacillus soli]MBK3494808.1 NERD domain-containing protein [Viridibacillus soli]
MKSLVYRLSQSHPQYLYIQDEIGRIEAGDKGEEVIMFKLDGLNLPYEHYIFHNLNLYIESHIQIDTLIITPYYIMIFEVKNIRGAIELRQNPQQLIRTLENGEIHSFNSPEAQLEEYTHQMKQLFQEQGLIIPVHGAVVFAFASSYIKETSVKTKVLLRNEICSFLHNMKVKESILTVKELKAMKNFLLAKHRHYHPYPLCQRYKIEMDHIKTGVICEVCGDVGMQRAYGRWRCHKCGEESRDAHKQTLREYAWLIDSTISNKECRHFLQIDNVDLAKRILMEYSSQKSGKYRYAKYVLPI